MLGLGGLQAGDQRLRDRNLAFLVSLRRPGTVRFVRDFDGAFCKAYVAPIRVHDFLSADVGIAPGR